MSNRPNRQIIHVVYVNGPRDIGEHFRASAFEVTEADPESIPMLMRSVLVVAADLESARVSSLTTTLRMTHPGTALTLLTAGDPANLRHLAGTEADEVVFIEDTEAELIRALARVEGADRVLRAARSIERAPDVSEHVRAAIVIVLTAKPPLHTAQAVAWRLGIRPNRLSEAFQPVYAATGWRLPDLLRVVISDTWPSCCEPVTPSRRHAGNYGSAKAPSAAQPRAIAAARPRL